MNNRIVKLFLSLFVLVSIGAGGYFYASQSPSSTTDAMETSAVKQASKDTLAAKTTKTPKTATLTLPEKTKNAWEMESFELPDTAGKKHTLKDWKGKVIMLNFWASWCAPCQFEIPRFVEWQKKYADKGLQIVGVGLDETEKLKNVERSLEMNYPTLVIAQSEAGPLLEKWGNDRQIIPYTIVIAEDGTIVYIHRGGLEDQDFEEYVLPLLGDH